MTSSPYIIEFNGKKYPLRDILYKDDFFAKNTLVTIGTLSLQQALFMENEHLHYVSREAETIDDKIIFFVNDDEIEKSDVYLRNILITNFT